MDDTEELRKLINLRDKLRQFNDYKNANMLDFMDWERYKKQHAIRTEVLLRLMKGGGVKIFPIFGGNRSGKTETGASIVCEYAEKKPNSKIMCATVDYKTSIVVQQTKIHKLLRKKNIKYGKFNPARGYANDVIILNNGSKILFRTYQQGRENIQGMDLDLAWLDEESPYDFYQEALARTVDRNGVLLFTFTSLSGFTRLVNDLWSPEPEKKHLIKNFVLSQLDNPFISDKAKEDYLLTCDPDEIESRVHGKPHLKEGLIYKNFSEIHKIEPFDHVILARKNPLRYELHEGIDPHPRTPHHWLRFLYDRQEDTIYICDELKAPIESMLVADFSRLIKMTRSNGNKSIAPLYCQIDTSSQVPDVLHKHPDEDREDTHTIRLEFMRNGIETILCTKDNAVGIGEVKKRLKVVKTADGTIKKAPKLKIFKTCAGVMWEFSRYSWDSYSSSKAEEKNEMLNRPIKKNDHFMDIIKYECLKMRNDIGLQIETEEYVEQYPGTGY